MFWCSVQLAIVLSYTRVSSISVVRLYFIYEIKEESEEQDGQKTKDVV